MISFSVYFAFFKFRTVINQRAFLKRLLTAFIHVPKLFHSTVCINVLCVCVCVYIVTTPLPFWLLAAGAGSLGELVLRVDKVPNIFVHRREPERRKGPGVRSATCSTK